MKSPTCLCNTAVHTGTLLIGCLTLLTELISIISEIGTQIEEEPRPYGNLTADERETTKTLEYAAHYADRIIVGTGLFHHAFYYALHVLMIAASILLLYANRTYRPNLYWPFICVCAFEALLAAFELISYSLAAAGVRNGEYPEIPSDPPAIRHDLFLILVMAVLLEIADVILSVYFVSVVLHDRKSMLEAPPLPTTYDTGFSVSYSNAAHVSDMDAPALPATYRI
ncbi:hypothetical protein M3Y99_00474200 [Aphelenchoides fujianensis]|nr:hypothetical protein M3Y99_00474200 [Aphelenchoides fujianensis]